MIIAEVARVRQYELTYVLPAALSTSEANQAKQAIEALLKKHKVRVLSQEDWGKRELAYPIKYKGSKQHEASYTHVAIESDAQNIQAFEKELYLQPELIRHLLVLAQPETSNVEDLRAYKSDRSTDRGSDRAQGRSEE